MAPAVTGVSAKDIAAQLYVGERTVETHLANIYRKLNVRRRGQLIARIGPPAAPSQDKSRRPPGKSSRNL